MLRFSRPQSITARSDRERRIVQALRNDHTVDLISFRISIDFEHLVKLEFDRHDYTFVTPSTSALDLIKEDHAGVQQRINLGSSTNLEKQARHCL